MDANEKMNEVIRLTLKLDRASYLFHRYMRLKDTEAAQRQDWAAASARDELRDLMLS